MKKTILLLLLFIFFPLLHQAQNLGEVGLFRAIWNQNGDPSTSITIGLHDPTPAVSAPIIYYDIIDHGTNIANYTNSQPVDIINVYKGMNNGFFRLAGLQPNTRYYFVIVDDGLPTAGDEFTSTRMFFDTAPNTPDVPLSIIAGGDSRDEYENPLTGDALDPIQTAGRLNANKMVSKLRVNVVVFGGDMTLFDDVANVPSILAALEWPRWFEHWQLTIAADGRITPIVVARGNHEYDPMSLQMLFDMPDTDYFYALSFGGSLLRLYTLNSEINGSTAQADFLNTDLENNCQFIWKMAQYHKPTRPHESGKSEQDSQRDLWSRAFDKHGVQLVVECDAHLSKYTYPINVAAAGTTGEDEGFVRNDNTGVVYIGEGGWGADLRDADDPKSWTLDRSTTSFNQIKWLWITQNDVTIRTIRTFDAGNPAYPDNISPLTDVTRFSIPNNMQLWDSGLSETGVTFSIQNTTYTLNNPNSLLLPLVDLGMDRNFTGSEILDAGDNFAAYEWSTGETTSSITVDASDRYSVTVTDDKGCTATDDIELTLTVLPVELTAFYGQHLNNANQLFWTTSSEVDNKHFEILASKNGINFESVGRVNGAGTTLEKKSYQYRDKFPFNTLTYYKLQQVDFDGKTTYSDVIAVKNDSLKDARIISFYPNPTDGKTAVKFELNEPKSIIYQVTGLGGKTFYRNVFFGEKGKNQINLNLETIPNGVYFLQIKTGESELVTRFIKK